MQENQKRSIVLASVLKPLSETRMTEKMAVSLVKAGVWQVHVIGFGNRATNHDGITFHGIGTFSRLSLTRLIAPWKILLKVLSIKPAILIVTTHELLFIGAIIRLLSRSKICYDVQENYKLNLLNTKAFPFGIRHALAFYIRCKEWLFAPLITHFFLAEKCYQDELSFAKRRATVIENKSLYHSKHPKKVNSNMTLLFSGTLDESTGVFEAIHLVKQLLPFNPTVQLKIVGYSSREAVRKRIKQETLGNPAFHSIGLDSFVPHEQIRKAIAESDFGIIYYPNKVQTGTRVPTKLYEYLALQLPIIYDTKASWAKLVETVHGGVATDFNIPDIQNLLIKIQKSVFYPSAPEQVTWETEERSFLHALAQF